MTPKNAPAKKAAPKHAPAKKSTAGKSTAGKSTAGKSTAGKPTLLSGGNPQIPKGYGDGPVQAYIAAMPEWKRAIGEEIDALVTRTIPKVHKAVKWNQPFYGLEDDLWFMAFRCYTKYVQLQFFRGTSLDPVPPKASSHAEVRYLDIHEDDGVDAKLLRSWIKQASALPGEKL